MMVKRRARHQQQAAAKAWQMAEIAGHLPRVARNRAQRQPDCAGQPLAAAAFTRRHHRATVLAMLATLKACARPAQRQSRRRAKPRRRAAGCAPRRSHAGRQTRLCRNPATRGADGGRRHQRRPCSPAPMSVAVAGGADVREGADGAAQPRHGRAAASSSKRSNRRIIRQTRYVPASTTSSCPWPFSASSPFGSLP